MAHRTLFTSESVTEGHPDKIADQISDAILDAVLAEDPLGRVACETLVTTGMAMIPGEITTKTYGDFPPRVRNTSRETGYTRHKHASDSHNTPLVISTRPCPAVSSRALRDAIIEHVIKPTVPVELIDSNTVFHINPTGRFVIGGPQGDTGLTGRKIIVDTYGGRGRHGGGAFSGKDPTKVDRSAAYMARYIAKNVVAAGLASQCEVQLSYAIGYPDPLNVWVSTFGTANHGLTDEQIAG